MPDPTLTALQRRLTRWELGHLRTLAAEQDARLERLQADLERAREDALRAWEAAEQWQRDAERLCAELQALGGQVGINASGELGAAADHLAA